MSRIQLRHDTAANWTAANPILAAGEKGIETDTGLEKNGNGATTWNLLPYVGASGSVPDATTLVKGKVQLAGDLAGTAALPTVPGLAGKASTVHTHAESDITSLVSDLSGKASSSHAHAATDVTSGTLATARLSIGTTAGTVAAGDDSRFGGGSIEYPWLVDVFAWAGDPVSHINFNAKSQSYLYYGGGLLNSSGAQNDEVSWDVVLSVGTWTIEMIYRSYPSGGIYTLSLDGTDVGTIDGYDAADVNNLRASVTGITVASGGKKRLRLKMATKNGASSGYLALINQVQLRRTA